MTLLWYSHETPDVNGQGGQRRQYFQIASLLRAGVEVRVASSAGPQDGSSIGQLTDVRRVALRWRDPRHTLRELLGLHAWLSGETVATGVVIAHAGSWPWGNRLAQMLDVETFVDLHNVHSEWYRSRGDEERAREFSRLERRILRHADAVAVCSEREVGLLPDVRRGAPVRVMGHGIDPSEWAPEPEPFAPDHAVKAFGSWSWPPNRSGIAWFLSHVWPRIRGMRPTARLDIAGTGADWISELGLAGVQVLGRVPNLQGFLSDAAAVVVPVMDGVGAPVKFAEALATGVPVIATPEAAHGVAHGHSALVSTDVDAWAARLAQALAGDPTVWRQARQTRELVLSELAWDSQSRPLVDWAVRREGRS